MVTQLRCWAASVPLAVMQASYQKLWHMRPATLCWYLARPEVISVPLEHLQLFSSVVCNQLVSTVGSGVGQPYVVACVAVAGDGAETAAELNTCVFIGIAQRGAVFRGD